MTRKPRASSPPVWRAGEGEIEVRFVGRGAPAERAEALVSITGRSRPVAWLDQRHGALCHEARAGRCGEGDALWTRAPGLALCLVTADCVPVALAGPGGVAAAHAGWRGIVGGVVTAAVAAVGADGDANARAWIGPAIGGCCYEVGEDVAARVAAASASEVIVPGTGARPHLDLVAAVEVQLQAAGVKAIERLGPCTRCSPELLHSYRRDGVDAGRNQTFVWLEATGSQE